MSNNEWTDERVREFGIETQQDGEGDSAYRSRVATALREQGHIIEAHEAYNNALYNDSPDAMTDIMGAVAQAMNRRNYSGNPIGNDIAAGVVAQSPKRNNDLGMLLLALLMSEK